MIDETGPPYNPSCRRGGSRPRRPPGNAHGWQWRCRHPGSVGHREGTDRQRPRLERQSAGRRKAGRQVGALDGLAAGRRRQGLITEADKPDAIKDLQGAVVRLPIFEGEPIRPEKIADSSSRILSSLLPAGKRAVATEISVATGAGVSSCRTTASMSSWSAKAPKPTSSLPKPC